EFIRRMAIYGYMLQLDLDTLQKPLKLMGNISNNINQIATRVNSTGNFYQADLEELQSYYRQLKSDIVPIILELSKDGV
ncbi:MAG: plasmid mobilization relaxosome protein MobC, partial [Oscillospiraceae bacterium]